MFDLVISGGDSFTFGAELDGDNSVHPHTNSWANLVAKQIGKNHINVARSGRSNSYIARHVLHQVQSALDKNIPSNKIFVQVMWTFVDRHEFAIGMPTGEFDSPWMYTTPFSHVDETESEWFMNVDKRTTNWSRVYNSLKSFYKKNQELGIVEFAKHYSKLTQSAPLNDSYTSIKEVLMLQNLLQVNNVPCMFTYVNQHVTHGLFSDAAENAYLTSARKLIDITSWYAFPGDFQEYIGFDDWAKHNKYEYATSHPLESAHAAAADLICSHIRDTYAN